ncbi:MAG: MCE family protein [Actinobacteria bacterium]|nr:MCE family protein [Actinomycetota bacterium]
MSALNPRLIATLVAAAVASLLLLTQGADGADPLRPDRLEVVLELPRAIGLYVGDEVRVDGVAAGEVSELQTRPDHVRVRLTLHDVALAADARATVGLASLIGERYVEIGPAWTGEGPRLEDGATLSGDAVAVPLELSEVLTEVDRVAGEIDADAMARLVGEFADALRGRSDVIARGVEDLARVSQVVSSRAEELDHTLVALDRIVTVLADRDRQLVQLAEGTAVVSEALLAQEGALGAAIEGLDSTLGELAQFIERNGDVLTDIVERFARVGHVLDAHRDDFGVVVDELPFFSYGFIRAIQNEGDRWYVVNKPRGILFQPYGPPPNSGPGSPEWEPLPRIYHTEDSPARPLVPWELDLTGPTGPGPLLPSLRIGPDGAETLEEDADRDHAPGDDDPYDGKESP